jgi:pSer/pThr/pTyr-binding forkhead associated (FHA) protein
MVQFKIVSGKMAGTERFARHFPFRIGRATSSDLQVEDAGVWEQHLEVAFDPGTGFVLNTQTDAIAALNGLPVRQTILRNGDTIEIGATKIRFWLAETRQKGLRFRERLTWTAFGLILALQLALIYRWLP